MSRARFAMPVFTDSKIALRDAVTRPSKRLSSWEVLDATEKQRASKPGLDTKGGVIKASSAGIKRFLTSDIG
jgi:hypothetical protein